MTNTQQKYKYFTKIYITNEKCHILASKCNALDVQLKFFNLQFVVNGIKY